MTNQNKRPFLLAGIILVVILLTLTILLFLYLSGNSGPSDIIVLDGLFEEWHFREPVYTDPEVIIRGTASILRRSTSTTIRITST